MIARVVRRLKRPALIFAGCCAGLIACGLVYSAFSSRGARSSVVYALFIGGAAIVVAAGLAGGGVRGQRMRDRPEPAQTAFGAVVIGALLIGVGIAVLKL